ncbi:MAG: adenosylcobinamide-phosphate synthase CbiB [Anaeromyxobacteraceae bacterium]
MLAGPLHAAAVLAAALAIDLALGEYPARLHPVVWMGRAISALERRAPRAGRALPFAYGVAMAVVVPAAFAGGAALALRAARAHHPALSFVAEALLLKATFAVRALGEAAAAVAVSLRGGDLGGARLALRSLCSRDASALGAPQIAAAAVESVAENASDSVVAPLLFWAVLGVPGAMAYRALNTLDARVGYRGRYEWLGKASARLDDVANLVPARLTAALLLAAGALRGGDLGRGVFTLLRDGSKTESPNAGRPMAAMAGLLGVELEKVGCYRLGGGLAPAGHATIAAAWRVAAVAALGAAALAAAASGVIRGA